MPHKKRQTQKVLSFHLYEMLRIGKSIETYYKLEGVGAGGQETKEGLFNGHRGF